LSAGKSIISVQSTIDGEQPMTATRTKKCTPVLFVDAIEPSIAFWEALGFQKSIEVPENDRLGFVILNAGSVEVMYQTITSLRADSPSHASHFDNDKSFLFVEVESIDAAKKAMAKFEVVMPKRQTFYESTEIGYREPGGHFVTIAQMKR
jgi:hypothetical protein